MKCQDGTKNIEDLTWATFNVVYRAVGLQFSIVDKSEQSLGVGSESETNVANQ